MDGVKAEKDIVVLDEKVNIGGCPCATSVPAHARHTFNSSIRTAMG